MTVKKISMVSDLLTFSISSYTSLFSFHTVKLYISWEAYFPILFIDLCLRQISWEFVARLYDRIFTFSIILLGFYLGPLHVLWQVSFGCWVTWSISCWQEYYKSFFFFNFTKLRFLNNKIYSYTKKKTIWRLVIWFYHSKICKIEK